VPTMPTVTGLELQGAEAALTVAGVLNQPALQYFGAWPITVNWVPAAGHGSFGDLVRPGLVVAQSIAQGTTTAVNQPVMLQVIQYPLGVSYP
jgi:hypothetical protein